LLPVAEQNVELFEDLAKKNNTLCSLASAVRKLVRR
jgi:hypothetical protein